MKIQTTVGEIELKPCPFCGGENIEVHAYGNDRTNYRKKAEVYCMECKAAIMRKAVSGKGHLQWCIETVTQKWNRRMPG